jgi:hypothetical protein
MNAWRTDSYPSRANPEIESGKAMTTASAETICKPPAVAELTDRAAVAACDAARRKNPALSAGFFDSRKARWK